MTLFEELKRRNVFRVGVAYVVGAWLLLQLTEVLSELLKLPDEIGPIVVAMVAIGFPIVVFVAWAYELTPEGIKKERDVDRSQSIAGQTGRKLDRAIIAMLVVVAAYFIWESRFAQRPAAPASTGSVAAQTDVATQSAADADSAAEPEVDTRSIAVLPFTNRSRLQEDEFFVEGIHDDLLTNLARIGDLKVISRTSVLRFKDTQKPIPEIAAELGVATVMEGAVQRSGDTVRINVQLIDARSDEHLWADIFDRQLTAENLFAIQSEISQAIANALKATLTPEEERRISDRPTENLAAYNAYLRGRQLLARRNSTDLYQAMAEFERAVELDPDFALAWVGVAEAANLLPGYSTADPLEMVRQQEAAAQRALDLNDQLGEAHLSMAGVHQFFERWDQAEEAYLSAIDLSPNYASAYQWYADFVTRWPRRAAESLELTQKAVELDPLSPILQLEIAEKLNFLGRFGEAESQMQKLLRIDPDFAPAYGMMAAIAGNQGRFDESIAWTRRSMERDPGRINLLQNWGFQLLNLGARDRFERLRQRVEEIDSEHFANSWLDVLGNLYDKNYPGALEAIRYLDRQLGRPTSFQFFFGFVHIYSGNLEDARKALEIAEPRFFDRDTWQEALELSNGNAQGCIVAWVLARTGEPEMGRELLQATIDFMEQELPTFIDHADRFDYQSCYAIAGDTDKTIAAFETWVDHGHFGGWWFITQAPWFQPLRGSPRFEAALRRIEENIADQRNRLQPMEGAEL